MGAVVTWRVYYEDGSEFGAGNGAPWEAPRYGVLVIRQEPPETALYNKDFYLWRADYGCWIECDLVGLLDHLTAAPLQFRALLIGRCVPTARYRSTLDVLREVGS